MPELLSRHPSVLHVSSADYDCVDDGSDDDGDAEYDGSRGDDD